MSVIDYTNIRKSIENELGTGSRGWTRIVENALQHVKKRADDKGVPCPDIHQIKEKLGELRIYYDHAQADDYQKSYIAAAITEANHSCERCGNACRPQMYGGWIVTLCCWCAHKLVEDRGQVKPKFNARELLEAPLRCQSCGYVGQIAWKASGTRCPACVEKGG